VQSRAAASTRVDDLAAALRAHWLDSPIVIVSLPAYGRVLSSLRLVRLARLMRLARASVIISRSLQAERRLTSTNVFRFAALGTIPNGARWSSRIHRRYGRFQEFLDGVWWATVTVTTVGYGDIYPTSVAGRIIAIIVMLAGVAFLAVLTATIASYFVKTDRGEEHATITAALARIEADIAALKARLEMQ
jgi:voltage-gated potassium channel